MPRRTRNQSNVTISMTAFGGEHIVRMLRALPDAIRNEILEPIIKQLCRDGAKIAKMTLRRILPKRDPKTRRWDRPTGALYDSLGMKTVPRSRMRNKQIVVGYFGARLDFRVTKRTAQKVKRIRNIDPARAFVGRVRFPAGHPKAGRLNLRQSGAIQPFKYIHLVEGGHKGVFASRLKRGSDGRTMPGTGRTYIIPPARPYPFMSVAERQVRAIANSTAPAMMNQMFPKVVNRVAARIARRAVRYSSRNSAS